jgi:hypothetical protein
VAALFEDPSATGGHSRFDGRRVQRDDVEEARGSKHGGKWAMAGRMLYLYYLYVTRDLVGDWQRGANWCRSVTITTNYCP